MGAGFKVGVADWRESFESGRPKICKLPVRLAIHNSQKTQDFFLHPRKKVGGLHYSP